MKSLVKLGVAAVAVVVLGIAAVLLLWSGRDPALEKLVRRALEEARAGEAEKCVSYVAKDYYAGGEDYEAVFKKVGEEWKLSGYRVEERRR